MYCSSPPAPATTKAKKREPAEEVVTVAAHEAAVPAEPAHEGDGDGALVLEDVGVVCLCGRDLSPVNVAVLHSECARGQCGATHQAEDQQVGVQGALRNEKERRPVEVPRQGREPPEGKGNDFE